jgi:protein-S-isoprenylcysteine O-methyltransferase Ste14
MVLALALLTAQLVVLMAVLLVAWLVVQCRKQEETRRLVKEESMET